MRNILLLIFGLLLILTLQNCRKEANSGPGDCTEANIIGQDFRRCACCGGWFIDLGQDTVRALSLPDDFKIDPLPVLPIKVCLTYEAETGPCSDFESLIRVNKIVRK